ncbi:hypothetical protein FNF27_00500 [Cafeteria roenbergensis]|uniref:Uncharacterized protein n=1 Tax=Cafeteria roenbergensis TaxID=33653 RepID=A0A5A8EKE8_CAFRO|nr:hypothetical protein FNF27_00500 [Cafeteria roenbergensis]
MSPLRGCCGGKEQRRGHALDHPAAVDPQELWEAPRSSADLSCKALDAALASATPTCAARSFHPKSAPTQLPPAVLPMAALTNVWASRRHRSPAPSTPSNS